MVVTAKPPAEPEAKVERPWKMVTQKLRLKGFGDDLSFFLKETIEEAE